MTKPWNVISDLETHPSRINKEQIIEEAAKDSIDEFFQGCKLALDSTITFGLKQIPERNENVDGVGLDWDSFVSVVNTFIDRTCTGHAARDAVVSLMVRATTKQWNNWYRRILIKDLRCGVSEKTVNKVVEKKWPAYAVPVFGCQLAHDSTNHESKLTGKKLIEVKLDGVRVITIVYPSGRVDQFSRNGKELVNFEHIKDQFRKTVTGLTEPCVFDGEIMSSSFQDLMKQVHRKENVNTNDAVLHLFDFLPLSEFEQGQWDKSQTERSGKIKFWKDLWSEETPNIQVLEHELIDLDTNNGQRQFKEINTKAVNGGYEGIMIKDPIAPYECKRTSSWLKLKPFIEVSLTVVSTEEGTGRNQGKMGALVCEGIEDGKLIKVNVGSGFSDQARDDFWNCRVDGHVVEVRADAITQNQDGTYSLRFPRFLRFRGFNQGEKI
jgi:DNA ligase-1